MSNIRSAGGLKPQPFQTTGKKDGGGNGSGGMFFGEEPGQQEQQQQPQANPFFHSADMTDVPFTMPVFGGDSEQLTRLKSALAKAFYENVHRSE